MTESDAEKPGGSSPEWEKLDLLRVGSPQWHRYSKYFFWLVRLVLCAGVIGVVGYAVYAIKGALAPILASLLLAYLFDPAIDWLEEHNIPRTPAILLLLLAGLVLLALFILFLYPALAREFSRIAEGIPKLLEKAKTDLIPWLEETLPFKMPPTFEQAVDEYGTTLRDALPSVMQKLGSWSGRVLSQTGQLMTGLMNLVLIPLFTFYFLRDFDRIKRRMIDFIPEKNRDTIIDRLRKMDRAVGDWCRGQIQVALTLAGLYAIGLGIVFGMAGMSIQTGIVIGILSGLLNFIPYLGVAIGVVLAMFLVIVQWSGLSPLIGVAIVFTIVQTLEGYFITPRIVGEKVGLTPVTVIIVLLIGGELFGFIGILLAVPAAGALKTLIPDLVRVYKNSYFYKATPPPGTGGEEAAVGEVE